MSYAEDVKLARACGAGDEEAWERFDALYRPLVERVAARALKGWSQREAAAAAVDVAAEVFAHLLEDEGRVLASYAGRSSLSTWLAVLARRRAGRFIRRASRKSAPGELETPDALAGSGPSPSEVAHVNERAQRVRDQLAELSPRDRLALQLFYEGGKSYREVAEALGVDPARVGTLLARARARLASSLGDEGAVG